MDAKGQTKVLRNVWNIKQATYSKQKQFEYKFETERGRGPRKDYGQYKESHDCKNW